MSRAKKQPVIFQEKLKIPKEFVRFATPKDVANYRAERLKCSTIVELGAGIGGQTIAFAKKCKKVIAVELNKERARILSQNIKKLKIKNVEIINGDALNKGVVQKIAKEKPDIVFFDTERPETSERTLSQINPPIDKIIDSYFTITKNIAIEIPPYTKDLSILMKDFEFEEEFISLNGQLNRLTLYFYGLKKCGRCAVALPSKEKVVGAEHYIKVTEADSADNFKFLYLIDPTLSVSYLEGDLASNLNSPLFYLDNKTALISNKELKSYFLSGFKILKICKNNREDILSGLKKVGAKKVTLRYNLEPQDYWKIRNFYEENLHGRKEINLFVTEDKNEAILCEKI